MLRFSNVTGATRKMPGSETVLTLYFVHTLMSAVQFEEEDTIVILKEKTFSKKLRTNKILSSELKIFGLIYNK